jgi:hypothetical protein
MFLIFASSKVGSYILSLRKKFLFLAFEVYRTNIKFSKTA